MANAGDGKQETEDGMQNKGTIKWATDFTNLPFVLWEFTTKIKGAATCERGGNPF